MGAEGWRQCSLLGLLVTPLDISAPRESRTASAFCFEAVRGLRVGDFGRCSTGPTILLSEVVTLARALRGFAHNEIRSRYLGFLMTVMLRLMAKEHLA